MSTARLHIRPLRRSDYVRWRKAYRESLPKKSKYDQNPWREKSCTRAAYLKRLRRYQRIASIDETYVWGIFFKKNGELIGILDVNIICRSNIQKANLGYRVFNLHWRKGYAKEFIKAGIVMAFRSLKINRLEAVIDPDNRPSILLAKSVGMIRECIRRKYYYQNKKWADQLVFTAQREDWGLARLRPRI